MSNDAVVVCRGLCFSLRGRPFGLLLRFCLLCLLGVSPAGWAAQANLGYRWIALSANGSRVAALEVRGADAAVVVRRVDNAAIDYRISLCGYCTLTGLAFAPDGRRITLLLQDSGTHLTQIVLADGAATRLLTTIAGYAALPRWSPDGARLALLVTVWPRKEAGAVQAGARLTGEMGALVDTQRIAVLPAEGGLARLVSRTGDYIYEYDWLPNGSGFVAVSAPGNGDNNWWIARLVAVDLVNGALREIYRPVGQITSPVVLADGRTVAFIEGLMSDLATASGEVWTVPLDGGAAHSVTPAYPGSFTGLARSGAQLVATAILGDRTALVPVDVTRGAGEPVWQQSASAFPVAMDVAGRTVAMAVQDFEQPPTLWAGALSGVGGVAGVFGASGVSGGVGDGVADNKAAPLARLGNMPDDAPAPPALQVQRLAWRNDGRELQGWLLTPRTGPVRGLVVDVHGGPTATVLPEYVDGDVRGALLAHGYALFLPNPRGSSGRGEAFKRLVVRDFGQGDFADILTGVDVALQRAGAVGKPVGLMGASYGGYLAMWANTRTDRFVALVAGAGIANWISYAGQNGINEWLRPFFGATPYDDPAIYRAASPIENIRRARTPTLLYVGERDIETPAAQSLEYWRALRTLGVDTTLVVYAGEGHAIVSTQNAIDLRQRIVAWFDKYLGR
jgi:dipeptidyl aminopeptidase/acylaminoacyl peptidase